MSGRSSDKLTWEEIVRLHRLCLPLRFTRWINRKCLSDWTADVNKNC